MPCTRRRDSFRPSLRSNTCTCTSKTHGLLLRPSLFLAFPFSCGCGCCCVCDVWWSAPLANQGDTTDVVDCEGASFFSPKRKRSRKSFRIRFGLGGSPPLVSIVAARTHPIEARGCFPRRRGWRHAGVAWCGSHRRRCVRPSIDNERSHPRPSHATPTNIDEKNKKQRERWRDDHASSHLSSSFLFF